MHSIFRPSSVHRGHLGAESIRELVFGVEDGVVQNMTLIVGMIGAALSNRIDRHRRRLDTGGDKQRGDLDAG